MAVEWKSYRVQAGMEFPIPEEVAVVPALSPGMALEYYLATHGMLHYNHAHVSETDADPGVAREQVEDLFLSAQKDKILADVAAKCDEHHRWEPFPEGLHA